MSIGHGETTKTLSVVFKPAANLEDEGLRLWIGNNVGDLHEIDIATQGVVASSSAHNRREVIKIFRHKKNLWSLDEDGKLCVWKADETGSPNLNYSHHLHKVQKGYTFGIVVGDYLWFATGKDLYVYKPGNNTGFQVLQKPLNQPGAGEITSGTFPGANSDRVYFGYTDGKVAIYNTKDYSCIASVKASDYKINAMVMTENLLWAAYKTGKIYVYDTSSSPWKVQKDWRAHEAPVFGLLLDLSGIWTLNRLHIVSLGQDNCIRSWDGMLKDDWIESQMHQRDIEYCRFREIRASIITWNVGASSPYDVPGGFLRDAIHVEDPPELLIFGFQELVDLEDRTVTAKNILGFGKKKDPAKDQQHVKLHTSSLIGLFLCVFVRQDQKRSIRGINAAEVKCGMKGRYGNKGALILRFTYDDSSLCFVNCHLAAGQTQTSHRNNDVATILEAEALPGEANLDVRTSTYVGGGDGTQILDHEICVLNGDLNYRIDAMPRNTVIEYIKRNDLGKLLERDQIMVSRRRVSGFRLSPFVEAPITFAPTYKYDVGTDNYDTSEKKRSPAWCDRLLYRGPGRIKQLEYRRHEVRISDHRPVSGAFRMRVKTIDPRQRSAVLDDCLAGFSEVKRKMAANASVDYLVLSMGLEAGEARKLISQG
ncbi:putative inositol polyphosphate [Phaeomoniella chlamydospora]|uniref:Putative inositol polyphosphate n=1 Tax=Phaeomoniella chlamydospora TaxID=158046 RepID=A0A0G2F0R1_PHACM|nr:putative inositol polyphosphate [Phaeomoniella chlamydospora]